MHTAQTFIDRLRANGLEVIEGPTVTLGDATLRPLVIGGVDRKRGPIRVIVEDAGESGYCLFTAQTTFSIEEDIEAIEHLLKWK